MFNFWPGGFHDKRRWVTMPTSPTDRAAQPPSSPLGFSIRRDSVSEDTTTDASPSMNVPSQDWSQWMRWDEPIFPDDSMQLGLSGSPSRPAFVSLDELMEHDDSRPRIKDDSSRNASAVASLSGSGPGHSRQDSLAAWSNSEPRRTSNGLGPRLVESSILSNRKRKTSSDGDDGSTPAQKPPDSGRMPSKKRAHNVIEKRYRANLNEKIAELRDSVPSLRASMRQPGASGSSPDADDADDSAPANKLNKASILSKATEYIRHLEIRNRRLEVENVALKNRLRHLDKVADQTVATAASASSPSNCTVTTETGASSSPSIFSNVEDRPADASSTSVHHLEGLIKVPDSFRQMRASAVQTGSFTESYIKDDDRSSANSGNRRRGNFPHKYMLGALAGLMILDGVSPRRRTESTDKGLMAVPTDAVRHLLRLWAEYGRIFATSPPHSWQARALLHLLGFAALVLGIAFLVFLYLFTSEQQQLQYNSLKSGAVSGRAVLTPSTFRRQAWLTSIQQVGVPRHRFFREWYAVTSRCVEYVLRCLLGWHVYSWITGITADDERGRVKTWDIAIDAQLAGGDAEISKSRLVLTIFAAGTLPRSPMRLMLKALHCRIILYRVGSAGSLTSSVSNDVARSLARYQWGAARRMHIQLPKDHPDALPPHLATLLQFECDEVMVDPILQRAVNLTWNRPSQEGADDDEVFLDVVEEDPAIQSSLDALAAWWSSHLLQQAILSYVEASSRESSAKSARKTFRAKIKLALEVAPQPSAAHTRALVMKAVFFDQDRVQDIGMVLAALPSEKHQEQQHQTFNFLDSSLPVSVRDEISLAVRCAMIAAIVRGRANGDTTLPASFTIEKAIAWFDELPLDPVELTLLGFAAVYHLLHVVASDTDYIYSSQSASPASSDWEVSSISSLPGDASDDDDARTHRASLPPQSLPSLGRVASELSYWVRNAYNPIFYGITSELIEIVENECKSICHAAGMAVMDYAAIYEMRHRSQKRKEVRKSGGRHGLSTSVGAEEKAGAPRRGSCGSSDTGYGSLALDDDHADRAVPGDPSVGGTQSPP